MKVGLIVLAFIFSVMLAAATIDCHDVDLQEPMLKGGDSNGRRQP